MAEAQCRGEHSGKWSEGGLQNLVSLREAEADQRLEQEKGDNHYLVNDVEVFFQGCTGDTTEILGQNVDERLQERKSNERVGLEGKLRSRNGRVLHKTDRRH